MPEPYDEAKAIDLILLKETMWKLEDQINVITESMADQEAELLRVKRLTDLISERLKKLELNRQHINHA